MAAFLFADRNPLGNGSVSCSTLHTGDSLEDLRKNNHSKVKKQLKNLFQDDFDAEASMAVGCAQFTDFSDQDRKEPQVQSVKLPRIEGLSEKKLVELAKNYLLFATGKEQEVEVVGWSSSRQSPVEVSVVTSTPFPNAEEVLRSYIVSVAEHLAREKLNAQ